MMTSVGDEAPSFPLKGLDPAPASREAVSSRGLHLAVGIVLAVIFALYAWMPPGHFRSYDPKPHHMDQYNLLTDGMLEGHLYLKENVPAGLAALPDPWNPHTNGEYRYKHGLWDQSYYDGKCYLYFGVTPVVTLYLPFRLLPGSWRMPNPLAVLIYTFGSLLFATGVLLSIRRRYFRDQPVWMTVAAVLLLGTANLGCYLLSQANIYQVAIAAGMCFSVGAIYFLVRAFERTPRRTAYLVAASLFLGLAAGARPHFAVTSVLLLGISAFTLWRRGDRQPIRFAAVSAPLVAIGGFLGLYNFLRFGSFFEFGAKYQLGIVDMRNVGMFGLDHVPSTLYFMFFQPPTFNGEFPYVHPMPSLPAWLLKPKVFILERVTGLFMATPFLWMLFPAAALAFARRDRQTETAKRPALELAFVGAFMGFVIFVLSFTCGTMRYLADFATIINLTAVVGWLYLDRSLAESPKARLWTRGIGLTLLLVSVVMGPMFALPPPRHYMDG